MKNEKDLELKFRIMRFLWYNGYFNRMNVSLSRFEYGVRASDFTDIDVWSIRFEEKFNDSNVITDCKSGRHVSNIDRIFWLSGLMKTINVDKGIFYRARINESEYFNVAQNLSITPISSERLSELEIIYEIDSKPFVGSFNEVLVKKERKIFDSLKLIPNLKPVYNYLIYRYWMDIPQKQIKMLTNSLRILKSTTEIDEISRSFLQGYILSLLSLSTLKFSKPILILPRKLTAHYIQETILGDEIEIIERKDILSSVYEFIMSELSANGKKPSIRKADFMKGIYPEYTDELVDLVQRLCLNPVDSTQIPRFFDLVAYEGILNGEIESFGDKIFSYGNNFNLEKTSKLAKNVITFAERSNLISNGDLKQFNEIISKINYK